MSWLRGTAAVAVLVAAGGADARLVPCRRPADTQQVAAAFDRIRRSVDPCGESTVVVGLLARLERCTTAGYEICTDRITSRNLLEPHDGEAPGTIIWNPELRTALEGDCNGDPARPVMRDPVASLVHELAHAVDDCEGRNPAEHELEAVRIENVYRRAAGLCQRSAYGGEPVGVKLCDASPLPAPAAFEPPISTAPAMPHAATGRRAADSGATPGEIDADPARGVIDTPRH